MSYKYRLSARADRYLRRAPRATQVQIVERLRELCSDPNSPRYSSPLQGRRDGLRRSRVGNLRVLFYVDENIEVVDVTDIGPRGDIYKGA